MSNDKHYIAVDRKMVMRCKWCGSTESKRWLTAEDARWISGLYCSVTCKNASGAYDKLGFAIVISVFVFLSFFTDPDWWSGILLFLMVVLPMTIICLAWGLVNLSTGRKARVAVPKNSRRIDRVFDPRYLVCENCHAPLEQTDGKTAVKCMYCGVINRTSYS